MMHRLLIALLAACSTPPLKLEFAVSDSPAESCGAATCAGIQMKCDAVVSIRILDPNDPSAPYISQCQLVSFDRTRDLCSLSKLTLDQTPLPEQTLEVQVVVYPATDIPTDPMTNDLICPTEKEGLTFDVATGFPSGPIQMQDPADPTHMFEIEPAIGGRAFYHKGDSETVVTLACNDLAALNDNTCLGANSVSVTATIDDFDPPLNPVSTTVASNLTVRIGEPQFESSGSGQYVLSPTDARLLDETVISPPAWGANIDLKFQQTACLEVLEDGAMATATLTCKPVATGTQSVDITGFRLSASLLDEILAALGNPMGILDDGLVIGVVYDDADAFAANQVITATAADGQTCSTCTIEYLAGDRGSIVPGGTKTSSSGIFVSRDAPFGTTFSTPNTPQAAPGTITAIGGLVVGKVTIVVLAQTQPPQNE